MIMKKETLKLTPAEELFVVVFFLKAELKRVSVCWKRNIAKNIAGFPNLCEYYVECNAKLSA